MKMSMSEISPRPAEVPIELPPPPSQEYKFAFKQGGKEITVAELKKRGSYGPTEKFIEDYLLSPAAQQNYPDHIKGKDGQKPTKIEVMTALANELSHTAPQTGEEKNWAWDIIHHLGEDVSIPRGQNLLDVLHAKIAVAQAQEKRRKFDREKYKVTNSPDYLPKGVSYSDEEIAQAEVTQASGDNLPYFENGKVNIHARADMIAGRLIIDQLVSQEVPADFDPQKLGVDGKTIEPEIITLIKETIEAHQETDDQGRTKQPTYKEVIRALRKKASPQVTTNSEEREKRMIAKKAEYVLRRWTYETTEQALKYRNLVAEEGGDWIKENQKANALLESFKEENPQAYQLARRLGTSLTKGQLRKMIENYSRFGGKQTNDEIIKLLAISLPVKEWQTQLRTAEDKQKAINQMLSEGDEKTLNALTSNFYNLALKGMDRWKRTAVEPIYVRPPKVDESKIKIKRTVRFVEAVDREELDDNTKKIIDKLKKRSQIKNTENRDQGEDNEKNESGENGGEVETKPTHLPEQIFEEEQIE